MYSILLFHTLLINILLFFFAKTGEKFNLVLFMIFLGCLFGGILLSFAVSNMKFLSKIFINLIVYIILIVANVIGFICCARLGPNFFELVNTMFVVFNAGSLTVLLFASLVKDTPSTFWIMISCSGGIIITVFVMAKIYMVVVIYRLLILLIGCLSFAIYESMNLNALDAHKNSKEPTAPSLLSLPFELNICFIKVFWYVMKGFYRLCTMCCTLCPKKKRRR